MCWQQVRYISSLTNFVQVQYTVYYLACTHQRVIFIRENGESKGKDSIRRDHQITSRLLFNKKKVNK